MDDKYVLEMLGANIERLRTANSYLNPNEDSDAIAIINSKIRLLDEVVTRISHILVERKNP